MPFFLTEGNIVSLGDFGSFRLTFKGSGADLEKDLAAANVEKVSVSFRPAAEFNTPVQSIKLEKEKA